MAVPFSSSSNYNPSRHLFDAISEDNPNSLREVMDFCRAGSPKDLVSIIRKTLDEGNSANCAPALNKILKIAKSENNEALFNKISKICEKNHIHIESFTPLLNKLPSQEIKHIEGNVFRIACMNQHTMQGGRVACGFHSFKNALCAVAIAKGFETGSDVNVFKSKAVYDNIESNISLLRGAVNASVDEDVSVIDLTRAWDALLDKQMNPFPNVDVPLGWKANDLSILNLGDFGLTSVTPQSMQELIKLKQITMDPGPCQYAFITGKENGQHFTTAIYEKDELGNVRWYGIDSDGESQNNQNILDSIRAISGAMELQLNTFWIE